MKEWLTVAGVGLLLGFTWGVGENLAKKLSTKYDRAVLKQQFKNTFNKSKKGA